MTESTFSIEPKNWFLKYRHILITLNKDFDIDDPYKNIERIDPHVRSAEIHIATSFDGFGRLNATKCLRKVSDSVHR